MTLAIFGLGFLCVVAAQLMLFPLVLLLGIPAIGLAIMQVICILIGAIKAADNKPYTLPLAIEFIK